MAKTTKHSHAEPLFTYDILRKHLRTDHGFQAPQLSGMSEDDLVEMHARDHETDPRPMPHPRERVEAAITMTKVGEDPHTWRASYEGYTATCIRVGRSRDGWWYVVVVTDPDGLWVYQQNTSHDPLDVTRRVLIDYAVGVRA